MKLDFLTFNVSLLVLNHIAIFGSSILTSSMRVWKFVCSWNKLVSSANSIGLASSLFMFLIPKLYA